MWNIYLKKNSFPPTEKTTKWLCSSWDRSKKPFKLSSRCTIISCQNQTICASASQNPTSKFDVMNLIKIRNICVKNEEKKQYKRFKMKYRDQNHHSYQIYRFQISAWMTTVWNETNRRLNWSDYLLSLTCKHWKQRNTALEEYSLTLLSSVLFFPNCWQFEQKS